MEEFNTLELIVIDIRQETEYASSIIFEIESKINFEFKPGQFITLLLEINGKSLRRSYSITSFQDLSRMSILVKKVPNGEASRYLVDYLKIGDKIKALPPAGRFIHSVDNSSPRDIFMLAAGSGIAPFRPIIYQILTQYPQSQIHLIYSNSSLADTIFFRELIDLQNQDDHFHAHFLFSKGTEYSLPERLNNFNLEKIVRREIQFEPAKARFYICGPSDYMRMASITLNFMGFDKEQILKEQFVVLIPTISDDFVFRTQPSKVDLIYRSQKYTLEVAPKKTILQAALDQGIQLPYSCNAGICATCASKCTKGKVKMSQNEVLTDNEVELGRILTCVSYPVSDYLEIRVG